MSKAVSADFDHDLPGVINNERWPYFRGDIFITPLTASNRATFLATIFLAEIRGISHAPPREPSILLTTKISFFLPKALQNSSNLFFSSSYFFFIVLPARSKKCG
ncbi:MAG: hypothetical protein AB1456_00395, partial [Thermodesulfobacteriota bacterium]